MDRAASRARHPAVDPVEHAKWQMMQHCWAVGQWERMEALGRELLVTMPRDADLLNAVGVAVFQRDRREEAAAFFREAIVSEPDHASSHAMMGWYWARRKKFSRAEPCLQTAISLEPSNDQFWVELGQIMLIQGNHRGARTCAGKALGLNPENVSAVALDSEAEGLGGGVGQGTPAERRARLEAALAMEPDNSDLHEALGEVFRAEGLLRESEERFRESLALDPSRPWLWRKVRRMGLKRDPVDRVLSGPWRMGLWLLQEGEFITLLLGLLMCGAWALVFGPVSFLYRLLFRVELELLAARGTRSVTVSRGRRVLRLLLLAIAAGCYWALVWWLMQQPVTWIAMKWLVMGMVFVIVGFGIYYGIREVCCESRHRRTLRELGGDGGKSEE